jgi:hypothetical protein
MIKNLTAGLGIHISGNNYSTPYVDMARPSAGMVRCNGSSIEVYDGSTWLMLSSNIPQIELDGVTQEAIQWVRRKMEEEKRMLELAKKHPSVADALAAVTHAEEQVRIVAALVDTA